MEKIVDSAKKEVKKRYTTKKGGVRIKQIAKDVMMLKNVLNPERKEFRVFNDPANDDSIDIGQCTGNVNAFYALDVSCIPAQGTTSITRTGNSIKISQLKCRFSVFQQTNTAQDIKGKVMFLAPKVPVTNVDTMVTQYFEPTPFLNVSIQDYNSHFNADYRKQFVLLGTKYFKLKADNLSTQEQQLSFGYNLNFKNFHTKFTTDGSQSIASGQIVMVVLVDSGNAANSTASTIKNIVPSGGGVMTGLTFNYNLLYYFYDN